MILQRRHKYPLLIVSDSELILGMSVFDMTIDQIIIRLDTCRRNIVSEIRYYDLYVDHMRLNHT